MGLRIPLTVSGVTAGIWGKKKEGHNLTFKEINLGGDKRDSSSCVVS